LRRADLLRRLVRVEITHPGIKLNVFARIVVEQFAGLLSIPFVQFTSKYSYATTVAALARSMVQRNPLRAECVRRIATGTGIESSPNVMRAARQGRPNGLREDRHPTRAGTSVAASGIALHDCSDESAIEEMTP
jgi:hypothetical protein